ncbi:MAG: oxidoreductase [Pseudomonadales bacterium]|nr:oxidoreductase [Pseudomonadales bacterium]
MSWSVDQIPNQSGKLVLITGSNSGIGLEAAKVLAKQQAHVVLACRNPEKGTAALEEIKAEIPTATVDFMQLDLASLDSVRSFTEAFKAKFDHLDVLINNAGVMAPPFGTTADGFESQFGTNHLGHFALTGQLLPLLEAAESGRVVVLSSIAHRMGKINFNNLNSEKRYSRWIAYGQSKLANLMFAKELQRRLEKAGSKVVAVAAHPGYSSTNLQRYMPGAGVMNKLAQSQFEGAMPTLFAATEAGIRGGEYVGPDGWMEIKGAPKIAYVAKKARNAEVAAKLWDVSESMTNVKYLTAS